MQTFRSETQDPEHEKQRQGDECRDQQRTKTPQAVGEEKEHSWRPILQIQSKL